MISVFDLPESPRCQFIAASAKRLDSVTAVYAPNAATLGLLGSSTAPDEAKIFVGNNDLPPNCTAQHSKRVIIIAKESQQAIGLLAYFCGYPNDHSLYIGELYILASLQGQKLGTEIVAHVAHEAQLAGGGAIYVNIGLKNWPAIRFWLHVGFDRLTRFSGAPQFGADKFASIELMRTLGVSQHEN